MERGGNWIHSHEALHPSSYRLEGTLLFILQILCARYRLLRSVVASGRSYKLQLIASSLSVLRWRNLILVVNLIPLCF